jgi:hypothetical protein
MSLWILELALKQRDEGHFLVDAYHISWKSCKSSADLISERLKSGQRGYEFSTTDSLAQGAVWNVHLQCLLLNEDS